MTEPKYQAQLRKRSRFYYEVWCEQRDPDFGGYYVYGYVQGFKTRFFAWKAFRDIEWTINNQLAHSTKS